MTSRREMLIALGAGALTAPFGSFAQSKQPVLIGWLNTDSRELGGYTLTAFMEAFEALGWNERSQFVIEERWANGRIAPLQPLAEELAAKKPAIIVAGQLTAVPVAARAAPGTPIVMEVQ